MKIELAILGLLIKGNLYGYEIKKRILEWTGGYVDVKFGSIYYAIKKALKNGWIKQKGSEKEAGNPERYVYQITPEGKKYYKKGLRKYFDQNLLHFDLDILLMFLKSLDTEQTKQFVEDRLEFLNEKLTSIKDKIKDEPKSTENIYLYTYIENHLKAELSWVKSVK